MKKKKIQNQRKNKNGYFNQLFNKSIVQLLNNFLLYLFIFLLPTQFGKHFFLPFSYISGVRVDYLAPTLYLTDAIAVIIILLNIYSFIKFIFKKEILFLLFLFILNIIFSLSPIISIVRFAKIVECVALSYIMYKSSIKISWVVLCFLFGALGELIISILQIANSSSLQGILYLFGERQFSLSTPGIAKAVLSGREFLRPYGTFSHPNSLAGFYLLIYFFVLSLDKTFSNNLIKYVLLLTTTCLVFISFSKIAISTYLVLTIIYLLISEKKPCRICIISRVLVVFVVGLIFMQAHTDPLTIQKRVELVKNAITIIRQHPIFGVGIGNYLIAQQTFNSQYLFFFNQPVHNIFLLLLAESGLFIFAISLYLIYKIMKIMITPSVIFIVFVVVITGFFDHYWLTLQQNILVFSVIFGLALKRKYVP